MSMVIAVVLIALQLFPNLREYMPFGGVEALMSGPRSTGLDRMLAPSPAAAEIGNLRESLYWLTITILGGACFGMPVAVVSERERGVWRRYKLTPMPTIALCLSVLLARYVLVVSSGLIQIARP